MNGLARLLSGIAVGTATASGVVAQTGPAAPAPVVLDTPSWAAVLQGVQRPAAPVVGLAVALPAGSGADPAEQPGLTRIAADAVVADVEARLGAGNAEGQALVEPDRTVLTFLVRPEEARALLDALGESGFGSGPSSETVERVRRRRADVLRFELDSPLRDVGVEGRALLYGQGDPRTRPPGGTLAVVEGAGFAEIDAARRTLFRSGEARIVAVGPVAAAGGAMPMVARTAPAPGDTTAAADSAAPPVEAAPAGPAGTTSAGPAWTTPDRRVVVQEVTNTWISVAFPVPADLPRIAVLFVADRMERELDATPPDPGLFNVSVEVVEMPEGEVLLVQAAVLPEAAERFERRILDLPAEIAAAGDPSFFRFHRGRFRASHLIAEAAPERAAARMAAELLARGRVLDIEEAVWGLDVGTAVSAAASLGPPRVLVFGPDLTGGSPP